MQNLRKFILSILVIGACLSPTSNTQAQETLYKRVFNSWIPGESLFKFVPYSPSFLETTKHLFDLMVENIPSLENITSDPYKYAFIALASTVGIYVTRQYTLIKPQQEYLDNVNKLLNHIKNDLDTAISNVNTTYQVAVTSQQQNAETLARKCCLWYWPFYGTVIHYIHNFYTHLNTFQNQTKQTMQPQCSIISCIRNLLWPIPQSTPLAQLKNAANQLPRLFKQREFN